MLQSNRSTLNSLVFLIGSDFGPARDCRPAIERNPCRFLFSFPNFRPHIIGFTAFRPEFPSHIFFWDLHSSGDLHSDLPPLLTYSASLALRLRFAHRGAPRPRSWVCPSWRASAPSPAPGNPGCLPPRRLHSESFQACRSLLGARTLLGAPGLTTRSKKLLETRIQ